MAGVELSSCCFFPLPLLQTGRGRTQEGGAGVVLVAVGFLAALCARCW